MTLREIGKVGRATLVILAIAGYGALLDGVATRAQAPRGGDERRRGSEERDAAFIGRLFVPRWQLTDGPHVRSAFREVIDEAREATVSLLCDGQQLALGGVVGADGWIVSKATPLCGSIVCELPDGRKLPAVVAGVSKAHDLALLKVEAKGLATLDLGSGAAAATPQVGAWLATVGMYRDPVGVGIVSVGPRPIPPQAARLGIFLDQGNQPLVVGVFPDSAADRAGLEAGDRIVRVDANETRSANELRETISSYNPGDEVELTVERDAKTMKIKAVLAGQVVGFPMGRSEFQNSLGGELSVRRFGFPLAIQHDTFLRPNDCGGPIVDLDGRVVGFNIARAGRTESFAIPTGDVRDVVNQLMTQSLSAKTTGAAPAAAPGGALAPR